MPAAVTIRTTDDILHALDAHPEWLAAVRAKILTQELLDLPRKVAQLAETVAQLADRVTQLEDKVARLANTVAQLAETVAYLVREMDGVKQEVNGVKQEVNGVKQAINGLEKRVGKLEEGQQRLVEGQQWLKEGQQRLENRVAEISGRYAEETAEKEIALLIHNMDLRHVCTLSLAEVVTMAVPDLAQHASKNDVASFCRADLIATAVDAAGQTWYVAVEVSYTADERDTTRALRNADYLTRLTGQPARAAVAAVKIDNRIQEPLQRGVVYWHALEPEKLTMA